MLHKLMVCVDAGRLSLFAVENKIMTQQQLVEKVKQHYVQGVSQSHYNGSTVVVNTSHI